MCKVCARVPPRTMHRSDRQPRTVDAGTQREVAENGQTTSAHALRHTHVHVASVSHRNIWRIGPPTSNDASTPFEKYYLLCKKIHRLSVERSLLPSMLANSRSEFRQRKRCSREIVCRRVALPGNATEHRPALDETSGGLKKKQGQLRVNCLERCGPRRKPLGKKRRTNTYPTLLRFAEANAAQHQV